MLRCCFRALLILLLVTAGSLRAHALGEPQLISLQAVPGSFALVAGGKAAPVIVAADDWPGVRRAAGDLAGDLQRLTGVLPEQRTSAAEAHGVDMVLIGTLGHSTLIDGLVGRGKLDVRGVKGQWEAGETVVVEQALPGVRRALVIAGADKRGTIFGIYTLSEAMGVSPWSWWADVPLPHRDALYVLPGVHTMASPAVRYRGIFLNDEAPSLTNWAQEKFGGKNRQFYCHVFELLLRLRANYLWPAMWSNAFNEDDPADPVLADEYGIVMGTSHHEPMLRAQQEWKRHGTGPWDYAKNGGELRQFWTEGIRRNRELESTVTVGMRGDGDVAMSPSADTALLERIVADQRQIIAQNADPKHPDPQVWALYKEVQEYYEKGMRVPADVTLLWCDDNWGNVRRLPTAEERKRPGGAGIYYHFDYVGGPRSYKWLNTYPISKVWEQMHLALEYGADRLWIVNVGDLKPMEFPIEFFLTMARTPQRWDADHLDAYTVAWATREFGPEHASTIAALVSGYTRLNGRRKPEDLEPDTHSLTAGHEAERIEDEWKALEQQAEVVNAALPQAYKAAFFELVLYPLKASATVNRMYIAAGRNRLYAMQGRASANRWADETRHLFAQDAELSAEYNGLLDGRWQHMMDQTHIGYTFWNEPPVNAMPAVQQVQIPHAARLGVFVEGSERGRATALPDFDSVNRQRHTIELAPMGDRASHFSIEASAPWIHVSQLAGEVSQDTSLQVSIDWNTAPAGDAEGSVTVKQPAAAPVVVSLHTHRSVMPTAGFAEDAGVVSIEAQHATTQQSGANGVVWKVLPGLGETLSGMEAFPVTAASTLPADGGQACLVYDFTLAAASERSLQLVLAPTLPFTPGRGLRLSYSLDGAAQTVLDAWADRSDAIWSRAVLDGVLRVTAALGATAAGPHTLKVCRVDPGVVLERLLLFKGSQPPAEYLGPPESARVTAH